MENSAAGAAAVAGAVAHQQLHGGGGGRAAAGATGVRDVAAGGAGVSGSGVAGVLVREVRHGDGKLERVYSSGARLVMFANGTRKVSVWAGCMRACGAAVARAGGRARWAGVG